jgi:hypothetical protein
MVVHVTMKLVAVRSSETPAQITYTPTVYNPKHDNHLNGSRDKPEDKSYTAGHTVLN